MLTKKALNELNVILPSPVAAAYQYIRMNNFKMKVAQTFGPEWIEVLNTLRKNHAKGIFI